MIYNGMEGWLFDDQMLELIEEFDDEENIMFKITRNLKEKITQLPKLPFITKDEHGYYRMYFSEKGKIRYLHLDIGVANVADIYCNIEEAVKNFDMLKEKIVKTELIISE